MGKPRPSISLLLARFFLRPVVPSAVRGLFPSSSLVDVSDFSVPASRNVLSSKEGIVLLLVLHDRFHVQDGRELFRAWHSEHVAWHSEHVKDQTSRQIVHCNLFAVCELKYVPLWAS